MKDNFTEYLVQGNKDGSNKARSYLRAIELLKPILLDRGGVFADCADLWQVQSPARLQALYVYVLKQQKVGDGGLFRTGPQASYWRNGFYSAAIKAYLHFIVEYAHEQRIFDEVERHTVASAELSKVLDAIGDRDELSLLVEGLPRGMDVLRETKTRLNQGAFRKVVLRNYRNACAITGLDHPAVLRASHIIGWADDEDNRMNPSNGICLNALHDSAFDRHLITFDDKLRLVLSKDLKDRCTTAVWSDNFGRYEGRVLQLPNRFAPDTGLLMRHREQLVG